MIRFQCPSCNKTLQTPPHTAGKRVACPCGERMQVPIPMASVMEEPSNDFGSTNQGAIGNAPGLDDVWGSLPSPSPYIPAEPAYGNAPQGAHPPVNSAASHSLAQAKPYTAPRGASQTGGGVAGGSVSGSESSIFNSGTIGGGLAMLAAFIWFFGGLAMGIIFFYPPILFIIGLVGFVKGIFNR